MNSPLIPLLAELGCLYPEMRFGQLFEMVAALAEDAPPGGPENAELARAASEHLSHRLQQLGLERGQLAQSLIPPVRGDLLRLLHERQRETQGESLGVVLQRMAERAEVPLYDAEDHQLLFCGQERPPVKLAELLPRVSEGGAAAQLASDATGGRG